MDNYLGIIVLLWADITITSATLATCDTKVHPYTIIRLYSVHIYLHLLKLISDALLCDPSWGMHGRIVILTDVLFILRRIHLFKHGLRRWIGTHDHSFSISCVSNCSFLTDFGASGWRVSCGVGLRYFLVLGFSFRQLLWESEVGYVQRLHSLFIQNTYSVFPL